MIVIAGSEVYDVLDIAMCSDWSLCRIKIIQTGLSRRYTMNITYIIFDIIAVVWW